MAQLEHEVAMVCAAWSPYLPALQRLHCDSAVLPCAELYLPLLHSTHFVVDDFPVSVL